ncbi:MAG: hypothetical protein NXH87_05465 [Rhodobiaceae bacterium]|nr:hypothetical protein [Rhodobiaceae bacterium]
MPFDFNKLNHRWNADPNDPYPSAQISGADVTVKFLLNIFLYPIFQEGETGSIIFKNCSKYRLGETNDEGWYLGQCRFSKLLPEWGEFYELSGDKHLLDAPNDWQEIAQAPEAQRHYLFYFRDETFECVADRWEFEESADNGLLKVKT